VSTELDADVLVVGGGPVGLAAAIEARLAGFSVVVVEPRAGVVDKACGEGLMPGALAALLRLGVDPPGHDLRGISYRNSRGHADHVFSGGPGRGVRRTTLHSALLARSLELGVNHVTRRVTEVTDGPAAVEAAGVRARWLLACDGLHSTVRRLAGLEAPAGGLGVGRGRLPAARRFGLRRHFRVPSWTDLVEVHWGSHAEAYVTPVAEDLVGIALLGPPIPSFDAAIAAFPELRHRLRDAEPASSVRGAGPMRQQTTRRTRGRIRLVGDASGYVDALTGEGLRVGFAQAAVAVAHLEDPVGYERSWVAATRDYRLLTAGLVAWASSPARAAIVPVARLAPPVYGAIVEVLAR
jgi:flavin-dependent dehydrogenase